MEKLAPLETVYATHTFEAERPDELSFEAGEPIIIFEKDEMFGDGWWQGQNIRGQTGLFPMNYTSPEKPHSRYSMNNVNNNAEDISQTEIVRSSEEEPRYSRIRTVGGLRTHSIANTISTISTLAIMTNVNDSTLSRPISQHMPNSPTESLSIPRTGFSDSNQVVKNFQKNTAVNHGNRISTSSNKKSNISINHEGNKNKSQSVELEGLDMEKKDSFQKSLRPTSSHSSHNTNVSISQSNSDGSSITSNSVNSSPRIGTGIYHPSQRDPRASNNSIKNILSPQAMNHSQNQQQKQYQQPEVELLQTIQDSPTLPQSPSFSATKLNYEINRAEFSKRMSDSSSISDSSNYDTKSIASSTPGDHPLNWDVDQVCSWLREKGFETLINQFIDNDITGDILLDLNLNTLKELSIASFGKRVKMMNAIGELKAQHQLIDEIPQDAFKKNRRSYANVGPNSDVTTTLLNSNQTTHKTSTMYGQSNIISNANKMGAPSRHSIAVASHKNKGDKSYSGNLHHHISGSLRDNNFKQQRQGQINQEKERQNYLERIKREEKVLRDQHKEKERLKQQYQEEQNFARIPPPSSTLTSSMFKNTPQSSFNKTNSIVSENLRFHVNKQTYSLIPEQPIETKDRFTDVNSVYTNIFATAPSGANNKARSQILSRLGHFARNDSKALSLPAHVRAQSTQGWDFLLEEEEDAIKELERIETEMESYRERDIGPKSKTSNSRAIVRVDGSNKKKFHTVSPNSMDPGNLPLSKHIGETGHFERYPSSQIKYSNNRHESTDEEILASIGVPDHEGWIKKQGEKYKTWKTRFCILKGVYLYYLKSNKIGKVDPQDPRIKGKINLTGYKIIPDENIYPGKYGFRAVHEIERMYFFAHEDAEKTKDWMKAMMKATILRDITAPVISSCNISTIPLPVAQKFNPRPSFTDPPSLSSQGQNNSIRALSPLSVAHPVSSTHVQSSDSPQRSHKPLTALIYQSQDVSLPPIAATDGSITESMIRASPSPPPYMNQTYL